MTYRLHYTSETYPQDGTWSVFREEYATEQDADGAAGPLDGTTVLVGTYPTREEAERVENELQAAL